MGASDCGLIQATDTSYGVTAPTWPFNVTMTNVRYSLGMDACPGDSGGAIWVENNDNNIAGIMHGLGAAEFTRTREGSVFDCGNAFYTSISSLQTMGLAAPWGMS